MLKNKHEDNDLKGLSGYQWTPENNIDPSSISTGDMPGDKVEIGADHIKKANIIFPRLLEILIPILQAHPHHRAVISVCGGSGVGKSETASLLSYYLNRMNLGSYTLSGDNYPHRIPMYNDAERLRIYRISGIKGLMVNGQYNEERAQILRQLQECGSDMDPKELANHEWLSIYQKEARCGLMSYLGTTNEIDFRELSGIIRQFKNGASSIYLKRMGRKDTELWYDQVDFSNKRILMIEWTHSNSFNLQGVDIPILLNSTPQETLEHRRARARDKGVDSPFTTIVLEIEQQMLIAQAVKASIILTKSGEIISHDDFVKVMMHV